MHVAPSTPASSSGPPACQKMLCLVLFLWPLFCKPGSQQARSVALEASRHPDKAEGRKMRSIQPKIWRTGGKKIANGQCTLTRCLFVGKSRVKHACRIDFTLPRPRGLATVTKFNRAPPEAPCMSFAKGHGGLASTTKLCARLHASRLSFLVTDDNNVNRKQRCLRSTGSSVSG